jgi:hypothetical protein
MSEEIKKWLDENVPAEKRWAITAQTFTGSDTAFNVFLIEALGKEKLQELNDKFQGEGSKMVFPQMKESFNIPVDDAIGFSKLTGIIGFLQMGPEFEWETVEESPERVVWKVTKCPWWVRAKEFGIKPENMICPSGHQAWAEEGGKAINPKIGHKITKAMPLGDQYCELVYEFKK